MFCNVDDKIKHVETGEIYNIDYKIIDDSHYCICNIKTGERFHLDAITAEKKFRHLTEVEKQELEHQRISELQALFMKDRRKYRYISDDN